MVEHNGEYLRRCRIIAAEYRDLFLGTNENRTNLQDWMILLFSEMILMRNDLREFLHSYKGEKDLGT